MTPSAVPFGVLCWGAGVLAGSLMGEGLRKVGVRRTPPISVAAIAALSGVGAALATGRPTTVGWMNVILRALVGAAVVVQASRTRRRFLLVASLLFAFPIVAEAAHANLAPLLVAASAGSLGLATASQLFRRRPPLVGALVGALLAQSALRLPTTLPSRTPSLLALVGFLIVGASGIPAMPRSWRRVHHRMLAAVLAAFFICSVAGAVSLARARTHALRGISSAREGLDLARAGKPDESRPLFTSARSALSEARSPLRGLLGHLGLVVPILSQHIRTIDNLANSADAVVTAAESAANKADLKGLRVSGGTVDLNRLNELAVQVRNADDAIETADIALAGARGPWLLPSLINSAASLRTELLDASATTTQARDILNVLPDMLGANGPRTYLLVLPTPAEARGSGGVIGNFAEITAVNGNLSLSKFGRNSELNSEGTPFDARSLTAPTDFVARYARFGAARIWQNANMGPDFPSSAQAMAGLYPQSGGRPVDGVISADPFTLAALLKIVGPISVASWPEPITADSAPEILLHRAYIANESNNSERITLLSDVSMAAWDKLLSSPLSPRQLTDTLGPQTRSRHLQLWMTRPKELAFLSSIGLAGQVPPVLGDSLGVFVNNASGNKIEWFLHRTMDYAVVVDPKTGMVDATLTVVLRNDAPTSGLPDYIIANAAPDVLLPKGTSRLYVSTYSALALKTATMNGKELPTENELELERNVFSSWVEIPSRSSTTLTYHFRGLINGGRDRYRLDYFQQPLVNADATTVSVRTTDGTPLIPAPPRSAPLNPTLPLSEPPAATGTGSAGTLTGTATADAVVHFEASFDR